MGADVTAIAMAVATTGIGTEVAGMEVAAIVTGTTVTMGTAMRG